MVLSFSPSPQFRACSTKIFGSDELHVTRIHSKSVLILMTGGILRFREDGQDIELTAGEYYIQREGLFQEGVHLGELPVYFYLEFNGTFSDDTAIGLPLRGRFHQRSIQPILDHFEEIFKAHKADPFLLNSYTNRVFSELWAGQTARDETVYAAKLIKDDLDSRYAERISIGDLARRFGYAEDYVIRIFKKQYGVTPHRYQITLRMEHARWLLENTSLTAKEVADAVGYNDFSAFWRSFRAHCGTTPGTLRK